MNRIQVANTTEVKEGEAHVVKAEGHSVLLTRRGGKVCAIENKCPHLGLPLARGKIVDGVITCPWHGSSFDVCSGKNVDWVTGVVGVSVPGWTRRLIALGKQPMPVKAFDTEEEGGAIFVKI